MLFAASDRHVWAGVRALALAAAGQVLGTAVTVVGLEAQRLGVALWVPTTLRHLGRCVLWASVTRSRFRRVAAGSWPRRACDDLRFGA